MRKSNNSMSYAITNFLRNSNFSLGSNDRPIRKMAAPITHRRGYCSLERLFETMVLSDVTFEIPSPVEKGEGTGDGDSPDLAEMTRIRAHKNVLAASSPVFTAMFYGDLKEKDTVTITDLTAEGLKNTIRFIYTNRFFNDSITLVMETLAAARKYLVSELETKCRDFVSSRIEPDNAFEILSYALSIEDTELARRSALLIGASADSDKDLVYKSTWNIDRASWKYLLELGLETFEQAEIYANLSLWSEFECVRRKLEPSSRENRREVLGELLHHVDFESIGWEKLGRLVFKHDLLSDKEILEITKLVLRKDGGPWGTFLKPPQNKTKMASHRFDLSQMGVLNSFLLNSEEDMVLFYVECTKPSCSDDVIKVIVTKMADQDGDDIELDLEEVQDGEENSTRLTTTQPVLLCKGREYRVYLDTVDSDPSSASGSGSRRSNNTEVNVSINVRVGLEENSPFAGTINFWRYASTVAGASVMTEMCLSKIYDITEDK